LREGAAVLGPLGQFGEALLRQRQNQSAASRADSARSGSGETSSWN
jgi:hypothetical protein